MSEVKKVIKSKEIHNSCPSDDPSNSKFIHKDFDIIGYANPLTVFKTPTYIKYNNKIINMNGNKFYISFLYDRWDAGEGRSLPVVHVNRIDRWDYKSHAEDQYKSGCGCDEKEIDESRKHIKECFWIACTIQSQLVNDFI